MLRFEVNFGASSLIGESNDLQVPVAGVAAQVYSGPAIVSVMVHIRGLPKAGTHLSAFWIWLGG